MKKFGGYVRKSDGHQRRKWGLMFKAILKGTIVSAILMACWSWPASAAVIDELLEQSAEGKARQRSEMLECAGIHLAASTMLKRIPELAANFVEEVREAKELDRSLEDHLSNISLQFIRVAIAINRRLEGDELHQPEGQVSGSVLIVVFKYQDAMGKHEFGEDEQSSLRECRSREARSVFKAVSDS